MTDTRPNRMPALAKLRPEPGLWLTHAPVPEIGPADVLIRIRKTGICGTDIHIWNWDDWAARTGLCCTNLVRDSCCESSVIAGVDEQTEHTDLQNPELARVQ